MQSERIASLLIVDHTAAAHNPDPRPTRVVPPTLAVMSTPFEDELAAVIGSFCLDKDCAVDAIDACSNLTRGDDNTAECHGLDDRVDVAECDYPHACLTQRTTWLNQLFAALGLPDSSHGLDRIASCREALIMEDTIANQLVGIEDPGNRVQRVTAWREAKVLETCSIVANHVNARRSSRVVTQADHYVPR